MTNVTPVANPDARENIRHGRTVFKRGFREPREVYLAHLWWNRGTAADHHFATGYREAAKDAGVPIGDSLRYLGFVLSTEDREQAWQIRQNETPICPYDRLNVWEISGKRP